MPSLSLSLISTPICAPIYLSPSLNTTLSERGVEAGASQARPPTRSTTQRLRSPPFTKPAQPHGLSEIRFVPERDYYQATNEETWEAYQALITIVQSQSKIFLPRKVLCRVADEVLWVLKSRIFFTPNDKKAEIERVLNPIPYIIFNQLVATSNLITDNQNRVELAAEKDFYQPQLEETSAAYKALLDLINP